MADPSRPRPGRPSHWQHPDTTHSLQSWQDHYKRAGKHNVNAFIKQEIKKRDADRAAGKKQRTAEPEPHPEAGPSHSTPRVPHASFAARQSSTKLKRHSIASHSPRPPSTKKPPVQPEPDTTPSSSSSASASPDPPAPLAEPSPAPQPAPPPRQASSNRPSNKAPAPPPAVEGEEDDGENDDHASMMDEEEDELASSPNPRRSTSNGFKSRSRHPFTADDFDYFVKRLVTFNAQKLQLGELYRTLAKEVSLSI